MDTPVEYINDAVLVVSPDGTIMSSNASACSLLEYEDKALIGQPVERVFYEDAPDNNSVMNDLFTTGRIAHSEKTCLSRHGRKIPVLRSTSALRDRNGSVQGIVCMVQDIACRKPMELALKEVALLAHENAIMANLGRIIGSSLNIDDVYERFAEEARKLIPFDRIALSIINADNRTHYNAYVSGTDVAERRLGEVYPLAGTATELLLRGISGLIIQTNTAQDVAARYPGYINIPRSGLQSKLSVSLLSKDRAIGALHFRSQQPNVYTDRDMKVAERIAAHIAGAVANAQIFLDRKRTEEVLQQSEDSAKRLARENELVAEIGRIISSTLNIEEIYERFAEKMREVLPFDRISINIADLAKNTNTIRYASGHEASSRRTGEIIPLAGTMTEEVIRTRSSLLIHVDDGEKLLLRFPVLRQTIQSGIRSILVVPLFSRGETIGALYFRSRMPHAYGKDESRLAEKIANQIAGAIATAQLYLDRLRAEEVLRESEARFRSLTELSSDGYWEQDEHQCFTRVSGKCFGEIRDTATLIGKTFWETPGLFADPTVRAAVRNTMDAQEPFYDFEYRYKELDGRLRYITTSGTPIYSVSGRFIGYRGIAKDITERRRDEQLLALEHRVYHCLADADDASTALKTVIRAICETQSWECGRYFRVDASADVLRYDEFWCMPGMNLDEFIARSVGITYARGVGLAGTVWESGQPLWVEDITAGACTTPHRISQDTGLHGTFLFPVTAEGHTLGVFTFLCQAVRETDGRLMAAVRAIGSEIGQFLQRKEAEKALWESRQELRDAYEELKITQSNLLQREKMASVGQLAAGVAHEINNPVGFIRSNLGSMQKYVKKLKEFIQVQSEALEGLPSDRHAAVKDCAKALKLDYVYQDIDSLLSESLEGTDRIKNIVSDLKNFSRVDTAESGMADIHAGIESTLTIVWNELKYKATVTKEYGDIPPTTCNIGKLNQVFMSLLINAAQAIDEKGVIGIRTWQENGSIYVTISDTGCGIPAEKISRIFDPFFTTKEVGQGTGLGLSIAYDIVKKSGGDIRVESEPGKGSAFTISIPIKQ